jgi:hypothetical protein
MSDYLSTTRQKRCGKGQSSNPRTLPAAVRKKVQVPSVINYASMICVGHLRLGRTKNYGRVQSCGRKKTIPCDQRWGHGMQTFSKGNFQATPWIQEVTFKPLISVRF